MTDVDDKIQTPTDLGKSEDRKINYSLYISAFSADFLALACGITFSWTSPVVPKLNGLIDPHTNPLGTPITQTEEYWIADLLGLGAIFGPIILGKLSDKIGRKKSLLIAAVPLMASFFMLAFATTIDLIYVARFLAGLGVGGAYLLLPMFLGEISEDHNRGEVTCLMSVFCATGILFSYIVGPFLSIKAFCLSCTIPLWFFVIFFSGFAPETPVYYMYMNKKENAEKSLKRLRNYSEKQLANELENIGKYVEEVKSGEGGILNIFKSKSLIRGLVMSVGVMLAQQLSGIAVVLAFMQSIFEAAGDKMPSDICVIVIGAIQVLVTIVTSSIVERSGRKILLVISTVGSGLSLVALGCYFYFKGGNYNMENLFWLPVASLIVYIITFNIGLGPLPWTILGEIFPTHAKSIASTFTTSVVFAASFFATYCFMHLVQVVGLAICFFIIAGFCGLGVIFVYFCVIETKGKSLLDIQMILQTKHSML